MRECVRFVRGRPRRRLRPPAAEPAEGVEHVGVDVLQDVEHAQLVAGLGPQFGRRGGVQIGAIGDDDFGREAVGLQVVQDAAHVPLVVGRHQGEGHGEVAERVGGQQQGAVAEVQFIDAQGAGEVGQGPPAVGGQVGLADLPVEAVGQEAIGQVEEEVPRQGLLETVQAQTVVQEAVDHGVADAVRVPGAGFDAVDVRAEGVATVAGGAVLSDGQLDEQDVSVGEITDESGVGVLAAAGGAAGGAREGRGRATPSHDPNAGVHAGVLRGWVW